jgi:hypothetical protein
MKQRNKKDKAYVPRRNRYQRTAHHVVPDSPKADQPLDSTEWPLVKRGDAFGAEYAGKQFGHPRCKLLFGTEKEPSAALVYIEPPENMEGKPYARVQTHLCNYVIGNPNDDSDQISPLRNFERRCDAKIREQPDVAALQETLDQAIRAVGDAERENEAHYTENIPGYKELKADLDSLEERIRDKIRERQFAGIKSLRNQCKSLIVPIQAMQKGRPGPHSDAAIAELKRKADEAQFLLDKKIDWCWKSEETIREKLRLYLQNVAKVPVTDSTVDQLKFLSRSISMGGGEEGALYVLGDPLKPVPTDARGRPQDAPNALCVNLRTIKEALLPGNANRLVENEEDGGFALFPIQKIAYTGDDLSEHIMRNVGNGIVGVHEGNVTVAAILDKKILRFVLSSEERYVADGIPAYLLSMCDKAPRATQDEAKKEEPERAPPPEQPSNGVEEEQGTSPPLN